MDLKAAAHNHLPARMQDSLRNAVDMLSPSRRRAARAPHPPDEILQRVSPAGRVLAGPFAGMRLTLDASWGGNGARIAGTYEEELSSHLLELLAANPPLVVDIGAAEGYYAVGIARRLPATRVVSFDIDGNARRICRENARLNGVTNLDVRGRVTPAELQRSLIVGALVICDCEGYEQVIIDPDSVPALRSCSLLVELHEFAMPGVTHLVVNRLRSTHRVTLVNAVRRTNAERPYLAHLTADEALRIMDEGRPWEPPMQWAVMIPTDDTPSTPTP